MLNSALIGNIYNTLNMDDQSTQWINTSKTDIWFSLTFTIPIIPTGLSARYRHYESFLTSLLPQVPLNLGYTRGAAHPRHLDQHSLPGLGEVHTKVRQLQPLSSTESPDGRGCHRSVSLIVWDYQGDRVSVGVGDLLARRVCRL